VLVSCDLIGVPLEITHQVRNLVRAATGLPDSMIMVHCTHTHSGPATGRLVGWGVTDLPYVQVLPYRIAQAAIEALGCLEEVEVHHAEVPCEGLALNREYDKDGPPLEEVLSEEWRPAKPELTDTTCHVIKFTRSGHIVGFASYFSCHPVVCCSTTRFIHGDFVGIATNMLEREYPGTVGLFLQGCQGDVNSCVVHKPEQEALLALDIIAARYARCVRHGLSVARAINVDSIDGCLSQMTPTRKSYTVEQLEQWLAEKEAVFHTPGKTDADHDVRMATVYAESLRNLIAAVRRGESLEPTTELQAFRLGPLVLLGTPFEVFQAIKREFLQKTKSPIPLLMGITNDLLGYAPDRETAQRGGYAADQVPLMLGTLPFANIHNELVEQLLQLEAKLV